MRDRIVLRRVSGLVALVGTVGALVALESHDVLASIDLILVHPLLMAWLGACLVAVLAPARPKDWVLAASVVVAGIGGCVLEVVAYDAGQVISQHQASRALSRLLDSLAEGRTAEDFTIRREGEEQPDIAGLTSDLRGGYRVLHVDYSFGIHSISVQCGSGVSYNVVLWRGPKSTWVVTLYRKQRGR